MAFKYPPTAASLTREELHLTHDNVMPLFAMSRELLIPKIQEYCSDFAQSSLECSNALAYLSQAVKLSFDTFRHSCVQLVAKNFASSFFQATDGLSVEVPESCTRAPCPVSARH